MFVYVRRKEKKCKKYFLSLSLSPFLWLARSVLDNFACFFLFLPRRVLFDLPSSTIQSNRTELQINHRTRTRSFWFRRDHFFGERVLPFVSPLSTEVENETDVSCFLRDAFLAEVTKMISLAFSCSLSLSLPLMWRQVAINASGFVDEENFHIDLSLAESIEERNYLPPEVREFRLNLNPTWNWTKTMCHCRRVDRWTAMLAFRNRLSRNYRLIGLYDRMNSSHSHWHKRMNRFEEDFQSMMASRLYDRIQHRMRHSSLNRNGVSMKPLMG